MKTSSFKRILTVYMKNFLILVLLLVVLGGYGYYKYVKEPQVVVLTPVPTESVSPTATIAAYDQSVSDGTVTFSYRSSEFGLATTPGQVLVTSYIPPCEQGFNYCLYYNGKQYQGTNFESAGLRIQKRTDISSEKLCLSTPPAGFSAKTTPQATSVNSAYSVSVFSPVSDAAAGHFSSGALYRLFLKDGLKCYEFATRIGQTQYANYPAGTIKQFTTADQTVVSAQLTDILGTLTLKDGTKISFPQAQ